MAAVLDLPIFCCGLIDTVFCVVFSIRRYCYINDHLRIMSAFELWGYVILRPYVLLWFTNQYLWLVLTLALLVELLLSLLVMKKIWHTEFICFYITGISTCCCVIDFQSIASRFWFCPNSSKCFAGISNDAFLKEASLALNNNHHYSKKIKGTWPMI